MRSLVQITNLENEMIRFIHYIDTGETDPNRQRYIILSTSAKAEGRRVSVTSMHEARQIAKKLNLRRWGF